MSDSGRETDPGEIDITAEQVTVDSEGRIVIENAEFAEIVETMLARRRAITEEAGSEVQGIIIPFPNFIDCKCNDRCNKRC